MALHIPYSIFHLTRLLYVRPETFGPYDVRTSVGKYQISYGDYLFFTRLKFYVQYFQPLFDVLFCLSAFCKPARISAESHNYLNKL